MTQAKFQFKKFNIIRSLIERKELVPSKKININFLPSGEINTERSIFTLLLKVVINDDNKSYNIEIDSTATFIFQNKISKENLEKYFFVNAPALLFPYIRAYISTLTNLSGFEPINLPTLNMTEVGKNLEANTKEV